MDAERLVELSRIAPPLAANIRLLEDVLANWRKKQDIQEELAELRAKHKAYVDEIAGVLSAPEVADAVDGD